MRRVCSAILLLCLIHVGLNTTACAASGDLSPTLRNWLQAQANVKSWSAAFVQTRTLKALKHPLKATGRVWFQAPNRFRWELGEPPRTIAVRTEKEMLVFYPRLKRVERFALDQAGSWRDSLSLLEAGFPRSEKELQERYNIVSENTAGQVYELVLEPKSSQARNLVRQLKLRFDLQAYSLLATELVFADGSTMRNDFHDSELNPASTNELFSPDIPEDYTVVEPLKK